MDRVRTGLTGLGLVFLFTLAASAVLSPGARSGKAKDAAEPLAQLGVAPGAETPGHGPRAYGNGAHGDGARRDTARGGEAAPQPAGATDSGATDSGAADSGATDRGSAEAMIADPRQPAERQVAGGPDAIDLPRDTTIAI